MEVRYSVFTPTTIIVAGPTRSGKTEPVFRMLGEGESLITLLVRYATTKVLGERDLRMWRVLISNLWRVSLDQMISPVVVITP